LDKNDNILVVCGGMTDQKVLEKHQFNNFTISSLYDETIGNNISLCNYVKQDAENLSYKNESFDVVLVHAGLHHCYSPHRALTEMYRTAKKRVIVFEAQDSWLMRRLIRFSISLRYEVDAVAGGQSSGVCNTTIPNYVYRWTKREVDKTIRSYDPLHIPKIHFETEFHFHDIFLSGYIGKKIFKGKGKRFLRFSFHFFFKVLNMVFGSQGNNFCFLIDKENARLHSWIKKEDDKYIFMENLV